MKFLIYRDWYCDPNEGDKLTWIVEVGPFEREAQAKLFMDKVSAWMLVDFFNSIIGTIDDRVGWSVRIIGPFDSGSHAGEFVDNLIRWLKE